MARRRRRRRVLVESLLALALGFAVAAAALWLTRDRPDTDVADPSPGAISVTELVGLGAGTGQEVTVTGYVFVGDRRAILCSERDRDDPPFCAGITVTIERLDTSRLDLVSADDSPAYSRSEVTVLGTYRGGTLTVVEIVQ